MLCSTSNRRLVPERDIAGSIPLPRRRGRESSAEPVFWHANARRGGIASPDLRRMKLRFAERIMKPRLGLVPRDASLMRCSSVRV
jgi:hypothetical protein